MLIGALGGLLALRSVVVIARDVSLARLQSGFLERTRMTVLEQVAGAGWQRIAALQHGRVAHLLGADFHACVIAGTAFINLCLATILLAALVAVAFGLSPLLAATVVLLLVLLAAILYPSLAFARRSGTDLAALGLRITSDLGQFLAGLKPALASNLEQEFVAHTATRSGPPICRIRSQADLRRVRNIAHAARLRCRELPASAVVSGT